MLNISNTEFLIITSIIIFQPFTNSHTKVLFLVIFLVIHNFEYFKNIYFKNNIDLYYTNKSNKDLDNIISNFFKNTNLNKNIYSILLTNPVLINIVKKVNKFYIYDPEMYYQFIYSLWDFLKLFGYLFHFNFKKENKKGDEILFDLIEKRNKVLMSISYVSFGLENDRIDVEIDKYIDTLFVELNRYIKMVQKKYNIVGDLPPIPINVVDGYIIF